MISPDVEAGNSTVIISKSTVGTLYTNPFDDATIRRGFVSKVFTILALMLLVTFGILLFFMFVKSANDLLAENYSPVLYLSLAVYFGAAFPLICCPRFGRMVPLNFILLGIFTLATSFMLATVTLVYDLDVILISIAVTFTVVLLVSLFSAYTSIDFTKWIWVVSLALVGFILTSFIMSMVMVFTGVPKWYDLVEGSLGVAIFIVILLVDMQMLLGGRRFQLSPEDYIYAALSIYLDIINLFLYFLEIFRGLR